MGKISFKFRQWWQRWRSWFSVFRFRRQEGVVTLVSDEDLAEYNSVSLEETLKIFESQFGDNDSQKEKLQSSKGNLQKQKYVLVEEEDIPELECEEVIPDASIPLTKDNLSQIKVGMIWYEDDTASFKRIAGKKIKAIVELIENGIVYIDLTASEIFDIKEQKLNWYKAREYIKQFSYPCKKNEKIVWYNINQLENVYYAYDAVRKTFKLLRKKCREYDYWSTTECNPNKFWGKECRGPWSSIEDNVDLAWTMDFSRAGRGVYAGYVRLYVRPVLSIDIRCLV